MTRTSPRRPCSRQYPAIHFDTSCSSFNPILKEKKEKCLKLMFFNSPNVVYVTDVARTAMSYVSILIMAYLLAEVSKSEGRVAQTTNVIIGGTVGDDATKEWLVLDQKVNSYPSARGFTAIGTGGDDFVTAMVVAVESVLQEPIPKDRVSLKLSSSGKYVSVNIGPILVASSEQVQAVYNAMRRDERMKYFL